MILGELIVAAVLILVALAAYGLRAKAIRK